MDVLVASWITETLLAKDHPQALLVLQLAQHLIQLVATPPTVSCISICLLIIF